eukprot:241578_1
MASQQVFAAMSKASTYCKSLLCNNIVLYVWAIIIYMTVMGSVIGLYFDLIDLSPLPTHTIQTTKRTDKISDKILQNGSIFQQYLRNNITNEIFYCNSSHFKYMELLMNVIKQNKNIFHFKWNSTSTSAVNRLTKNKMARFKYINNKLYIDKTFGSSKGWGAVYYRAFITYFWIFTEKYKHNLPSFDIIIYYQDNLRIHYEFIDQYNDIPPIFMSDSYTKSESSLLFHGLSRSIVKNRFYTIETIASKSEKMGGYVIRNYKNVSFANKINKILFRGQLTNQMRDTAIYALNNNNNKTYIKNMSFVDAKLLSIQWKPVKNPKCIDEKSNCWISVRIAEHDQEKYKYLLVMDGFTTRDAFVHQMFYDSVKVKYKSNLYEFWYYDLIDKHNILYWNNVTELIDIINDLIDNKIKTVGEIARNSANYGKSHFDQISLDCFMLHMINIYNYYFFNESGVELEENDILVDFKRDTTLDLPPVVIKYLLTNPNWYPL